MIFNSYYEFTYYKKTSVELLNDEEVIKKLNDSVYPIIGDDLKFLLEDSKSSLIEEVKTNSSKKTFYKDLLEDSLSSNHLPALCSFMTHLSIGIKKRIEVRKEVNFNDFYSLRKDINDMIDDILKEGKTKNKLYSLIK